MSTISGVSSSSDPWAAMKAQHAQRQAKMFAKVDANSDGSVDQAELKTMLSDVSKKTGVNIDSSVADTFTQMDSNTDGKLSSDELSKGMRQLMPPPSTMDFAQTRSADSTKGSQDDLFAKIDTNGDGSIDKAESQVLSDKIKAETGKDTSDMFGKLDKDGDGKLTKTEFDAGKPQGGVQGAGGPKGPGGPGGPGGPPPAGGPGGAGNSEETSTTYDPLDTNQDGTVSEMERLVGAIKDAISASKSSSADNDNDSSGATASTTSASTDTTSNSANGAIAKLAKLIYAQIAEGFAGNTNNTLSASA